MNDEDIPNSLPDVLKREIGLTKEELNLNPQGIQGALNLLSTLRLNRVKKEEDIIRVLDDVLEELLNKVIPWTEQILKVIQGGRKTEGLIEWLFQNPGAERFFSGYMLYHVQRNILKVEKISSKLVIRLNLANEVLNYLSSIDRARRRTWRMYELYLRGERSMVGSLPVGFILSAHKTTQTVLSFFEEYGDSIFFELNVEMRDIIKRFVQNLELSKTMLPKLKADTILEELNKIQKQNDAILAGYAELKAQEGKIEQGVQEVKQEIKDKIEPKQEEKWVRAEDLSKKLNLSARRIKMGLYVRNLKPAPGGLYIEGEALAAWNNGPKMKNIRKEYEKKKEEEKRAAKVKPTAATAKKKRGPAR